ncbi:MAG: peptidase M19, renal dipeptidase [uncultured Truepera sp.]|uniref:Peptidase M19, renal dipeptidase n=1 Tax=uncultured Truepera sp. TaxID=543023 RepID=A0A6J4VX16_9DEIN|nr:MAG: peptidase M19, renal dipeptidase [uncultured Truepera sp.]
MYIDGHLDLAYNALAAGRDLTLPLDTLREQGHPDALVTLPELRAGGVGIVFGTIYVRPAASVLMSTRGGSLSGRTYETPEEARALGLAQLELYERWEDEGHLRILRSKGDLEPYTAADIDAERPLGLVLLMEGADPLVTPDDLGEWTARGLRLLGPAWQRTRYAGGTKAPGPLTELGVELMHAMREEGVVLDISHLSEESFWNALEAGPERVIASHSNARAFVPTDRHLSDAMIRALGAKDGVMGLVIANVFLSAETTSESPKTDTTLAHVTRHAEHIAGLIGWDKVAVGTDFDGGFGVNDVPAEIGRAADFARLGDAVPEAVRADFLGRTWLQFLMRALPDR